jgi:hypothetical protein
MLEIIVRVELRKLEGIKTSHHVIHLQTSHPETLIIQIDPTQIEIKIAQIEVKALTEILPILIKTKISRSLNKISEAQS